ncbi:hypothetical protein MNBD_GAMMA01-702 [hydrothermal vent metagenome]|uniref:HEAT repeat domain-containing protein n=1 Tax=hydrothermal vent metagenome TaxID=652676 RepID=A0A3B0VHR2_9ZZZZ
MSKKYKSMTAKEFLKILENDPEYQKRTKNRNAELDQIHKARDINRAPLLADLKANGIYMESEWEFSIKNKSDAKAIPILLKHLDKDYDPFVKEGIYRCLRTPFAKGKAGQKLIEKFKIENDKLRWVIGHVLDIVATEDELENIEEMITNATYGDSISELIYVYCRLKGKNAIPKIIQILERIQDKKDYGATMMSCIDCLGKLKSLESLPLIEFFIKSKQTHIRNQAKKALRKINAIKQIVPKLPKGIKYIKDNKFAYKYEASTEFDPELVPVFLKLLCEKINADPKVLENLILDTEVEETKTYELQVKQLLRTSKLYFQIFMDDIDTPGLYFFSNSKSLIKTIAKVMDQFMGN